MTSTPPDLSFPELFLPIPRCRDHVQGETPPPATGYGTPCPFPLDRALSFPFFYSKSFGRVGKIFLNLLESGSGFEIQGPLSSRTLTPFLTLEIMEDPFPFAGFSSLPYLGKAGK